MPQYHAHYLVKTPVSGILSILLYSQVCLQSQDDSLIRQTVTPRGTHEYPITEVHIFKTHGLFLHSSSIKHTAQPCLVTWYRAEETKAAHVFMYKEWIHANMRSSAEENPLLRKDNFQTAGWHFQKPILVWNPAEMKLKEACSKKRSVEKFGSKRKSSCFVYFDSIRYPHFKRSWRYTNWVQNAVCRPSVSLQRGLRRWSTNEKHFSAVQINKSPLRSKSFTSTPKSLTQKLNL